MRYPGLFTIPFLLITLFFGACKKNTVEENYTPIVNPLIPDFTTLVTASVHGFVTNENGEAAEGATVTAGAITVTTDEFGYFKISNAAFAKSAGFIQVRKAGYFTGYRTFLPVTGKETFTRLQLIPKTTAGIIESVAGGTVTLGSGATITLPADAVVVASDNSPYAGAIEIAAYWYNPADMETTSLTMPGDLTGVDSAGHLNVLQTFGMLAVELTGSGGELLQIAVGKKASLHFPLPSSLQSSAPSGISLWYFDEQKGVWKQEGHAVRNGSSYDGDVSHFSFWNCDIGLQLVNFTAQLVDTSLHPLVNIPVTITATNILNLSRTAYTNSEGVITGLVPANSTLTIDILSPCSPFINASTVKTTNEPVDLGTLTINPEQYANLIEGTVTKCNGSPVTDGYVVLTGFGNNVIININNGVFSRHAIFCPGTNANIIAFDREASQQSSVQSITITTGTNNSGELQACSASPTEIVTANIEGVGSFVFTLPQHLFGGNFYFANDSTSINAVDLLNGNEEVFQMSFTGPATTGIHPLANGRIVRISNSSWVFEAGTTVNISSYGFIGQFITGTINGNATGSPPLSITRPVNIEFSIKRDQ